MNKKSKDAKAAHGKRSKGSMSVKLSDVAKLAGISTTTASRVFNSPDKVRPEVILRVKKTAEKLGFVLNSAARALRSRRTRMIGVIIPTLEHAIFAKLVNALQDRLTQRGYSLVITTSDWRCDTELAKARILFERGIEGVVLLGDLHDPKLYQIIREQNMPYVNTYAYKPQNGHACVGLDNNLAARRVVNHLLDLGHRHVGMVAGISRDNDRVQDRIQGVRDALHARGLELADEMLIEKPYEISAGKEGIRFLLNSPRPPTAVVTGSDVLAFGVLAECKTLGIDVPRHLSVVGFDNLDFAVHLRPALTTIEVPAQAMGERAADYLFQRLQGEQSTAAIELDAPLILRGTTGPVPSSDS